MNTNTATTVLGGLAGVDLFIQSLQVLLTTPTVPNAIHAVAALAIVGWAYFTNHPSTGMAPAPAQK